MEHKKPPNKSSKVVVYKHHGTSLFGELYAKDQNIRLISQVLILSMFFVMVSVTLNDSIEAGRLSFKTLNFIKPMTLKILAFSILTEVSLVLAAFSLYPLFKLWAKLRSSCSTTVVDVIFITLYSVAIVGSFVYMLWICSKLNAPHYVNFTLATEQIRLCMKTYSFVRENAYKVLYPWHKDDSAGPAVWYAGQMSPSIGSFRQYLYFLIAPTLLYRDHYPRNMKFDYNTFVTNVFLFILSVLFAQYLFGILQIDDYHWTTVLLHFLTNLPLGFVYGITMNVIFMHSWMNIWAELTGFSDRRFYEDWWLSVSYYDFYRKWDIIPYHFNQQYIYKDIQKVFSNKYLSLLLLFSASSAYHEYIMGVGFGYTVPTLTLFFAGVGPIVIILRLKGTFPMMCSLCFGIFFQLWYMVLETKSRTVCEREETFIDLFYPRLLECIMKHSV